MRAPYLLAFCLVGRTGRSTGSGDETVVIAQIVAALGAEDGGRVREVLPRPGARADTAALYALRGVLAGDLPAGDGTGGLGTGFW
ncbi:hypothetical protein [Kitasatospora herbaricolor]|uniref:Uncharacterized protein n=1 Tax=Kitasatospora herbaricolor TaxID=68217 RepID=A0ABZ1WJR1_9ACTN|nr:hypothetical protein [Kitasatospora herbaricolor]